ncbi:hypothetical protein D3C77_640630 [compost metagenome]
MRRSEQNRRKGWLPEIRSFEEEALVREKANNHGMSVGQFVLAAALKRRTRSKIAPHVINELWRLGGLQKHLFSQRDGALSREYANVLQ